MCIHHIKNTKLSSIFKGNDKTKTVYKIVGIKDDKYVSLFSGYPYPSFITTFKIGINKADITRNIRVIGRTASFKKIDKYQSGFHFYLKRGSWSSFSFFQYNLLLP